jgi:sortase A
MSARTWARRALYAVGLSLLAYCGFVLLDARQFQARENSLLNHLLAEKQVNRIVPSSLPAPGVPAQALTGSLIGRIEIPRLGLSEVITEGSDAKTLRRSLGHIPQTPLPGQAGNTAITGHRDTFFRPLKDIRRNDLITITTLQGEFLYRVVSTSIVEPSDVEVLNSAGTDEALTLITCYPFYFVGAAPHRFIVRAERVLQLAAAR